MQILLLFSRTGRSYPVSNNSFTFYQWYMLLFRFGAWITGTVGNSFLCEDQRSECLLQCLFLVSKSNLLCVCCCWYLASFWTVDSVLAFSHRLMYQSCFNFVQCSYTNKTISILLFTHFFFLCSTNVPSRSL